MTSLPTGPAITTPSTTAQATATAAPITPARLQQVSGFGSNPTGTQMFIYVPNRLAANPAIVVAVSFQFGAN